MFRPTVVLLAVALIVGVTTPVLADNSVAVSSMTVAPNETDVIIPIAITNDVELSSIVVPLVIREVTAGSFITSLELSYSDRLPEGGGEPLSEIVVKSQCEDDDGSCKVGAFGPADYADGGPHPVVASPEGVLFARLKIVGSPTLAPGTDASGSLRLTVDVTGTDGTFEIDTTCVDPNNHLLFQEASASTFTPTFFAGTITIDSDPPDWVQYYNGPGDLVDNAEAVAVDASGNIYVTGESLDAETDYGIATIKYDPYGNVLWEHRLEDAQSPALHVSADGYAYVSGSGGDYPAGRTDAITYVLSPDGDTVWVRGYNPADDGRTYVTDIAVDVDGNVYITGECSSVGSDDFMVVKYSPDGDTLWARCYDGPDARGDCGWAIDVDADGNVIAAGYVEYAATYEDLLILKYDADGNLLWDSRYAGPAVDYAFDMQVDLDGNIYVTGNTGWSSQMLTMKYDPDGDSLWMRLYGGTSAQARARDLELDAAGNVVVTGYADPGVTGSSNVATVKYNPDGDTEWASLYTYDTWGDDEGNALALDALGNVYVTGFGLNTASMSQDCLTLMYKSDGTLVHEWIFDGPPVTTQEGADIVVDHLRNVIVAGLIGVYPDEDYFTLKYAAPPLTGHIVMVESKTVGTDEQDATVRIAIANDLDLAGLQLPLVARSVIGNAFWSADLDTLQAYGRLTSALTGLRVINAGAVDYISPDPFILTYARLVDPCLASGPLQNMITLTFDVGPDPGVFEIDSALYPPSTGLGFVECGGTELFTPQFQKGTITVMDDTPPIAQCPSNTLVETDPGQCGAIVEWIATFTDNAPGGSIVCDPPSGSFFPVGMEWVMCIATDEAGNADTCSFSVTVEDFEPPTLVCPEDVTVEAPRGVCEMAVTYPPATGDDNCGDFLIDYSPPSGSLFPAGGTPVTVTATDVYGNERQCAFTVTVNSPGCGPNALVLDSMSVAPGATGVAMVMQIANDVDLNQFQIPLVARSVVGSAFWANDVDTASWGRLSGALTFSRNFDDSQVDFASPDAVALDYHTPVELDCLPAGPLDGMLALVFDVNEFMGTFEIDTALFPPSTSFTFRQCSNGLDLGPEFLKGYVTIEPPMTGNRIAIESKNVDPGAAGVELEISIANEVPLSMLSMPLVARTLSGGAFWTNDVDTSQAYGRLTNALTESREFWDMEIDFHPPDPCVLFYYTSSPVNCLTAGGREGMVSLLFDVTAANGEFEIDTAFFAPTYAVGFLDCGAALVPPEFHRGIVTVGTPPTCGCDCHCDPQCDAQTNVLDVVLAVNVAFRGAGDVIDPNAQCPYTDTDADCSGFTNVIDVVKFVNVAFRGGTAEDNFCDPCP